jgi:hypothetical protein
MGLNVGVRHKNTTLPKKFTVPKTNTDRNQSGLNVGVQRRNRHYRIILLYQRRTDRTQLIPQISVSLWKTVRKKPKELQVWLNKKLFHKSESSYEKMSLDHITVKTTDEYETQTDNSDSPSGNKRTKFTNTRHINTELKILMHSQQLKSKDFFWCAENNQPLWMGIINVHCLKDISNSHIYYRFKRGKPKRLLQSVSNPKSPKKISTQTAIVSTIISLDINMEYYKII